MTRDYKVTFEDFVSNNGYSGKHFFNHVKRLLEKCKDITGFNMQLYRYKAVVENTEKDKKYVIKVHWNGHSPKYATLLTKTNKEVLTIHHTVPVDNVIDIIISLLELEA